MRSGRFSRRLGLGLVLCAVAATVLYRSFLSQGGGWSFSFGIPAGMEVSYAFAIDTEQGLHSAVPMGGASLVGGKSGFSGTVSLSASEGGLARVKLKELTRHDLVLLGTSVIPDSESARTLLENEALVELRSDGAFGAFYTDPQAPPLYRRVLQYVLAQMQLSLCLKDGKVCRNWEREERGAIGNLRVSYSIGSERFQLLRTPERYVRIDGLAGYGSSERITQSLEGSARIELDPRGFLRALDSTEKLQVFEKKSGTPWMDSSVRCSFVLKAFGPAPASGRVAPLDQLKRQEVSDFSAGAELARRALQMRAAGLQERDVLMGIELYGLTGKVDVLEDWFFRASALLELNPELMEALKAAFRKNERFPRAQTLILELLAAAGTPQAQDAMLELLQRSEPGSLQRLSFLREPTARTLAFMKERFEERAGPGISARADARAAAYTYGALAGTLREIGDEKSAEAAGQSLLSAYREASAGQDRAVLLDALGNAGVGSTVDAIAAAATDSDPAVRKSSAQALRKFRDDSTLRTLVRLSQDSDESVQVAALQSLMDRDSNSLSGQVRLICEGVRRGGISQAALAHVITLIEMNELGAKAEACLVALVQDPGTNDSVRRRALALLSGIPGRG